VVRRQFKNLDGSKLERKLLDYQTHMFKLAPLLALAFTNNIAARELIDLHKSLMDGSRVLIIISNEI